MQPAEDESSFHVGQNLDILDSVNKWMNAEVLFAGNGTIFIHYTGWSYKYDESIPTSSPRILKQWKPGQPIRLNNRIDAYHSMGGWLEARVIEIGEQTETSQPVRVHFFNYNKKYDMWVDLCDNNQVAIIGSRSRAYGMGKNRSKSYRAKLSELAQSKLWLTQRYCRGALRNWRKTCERSTSSSRRAPAMGTASSGRFQTSSTAPRSTTRSSAQSAWTTSSSKSRSSATTSSRISMNTSTLNVRMASGATMWRSRPSQKYTRAL